MKYFYLLLSLFYVSAVAQKAPSYGITDFNFITEHVEDTYNNDTWLNNILDTGWDVTAFDNTGEFNFKRFPYGGINNIDGSISLDNWDMKYLRIKSNDGSAFKFNSIYLKPDTNLYATFKGFLKGVEVASTDLSSRTPERWSNFSVEEYPAFGNVDEIRIILNVRTYFVGIDNIDISAPILSTSEIKKNPILIVSKNNELIINSSLETKFKIYSSTGKLIMNQNLQIGKNTFKTEHIAKGMYFLNYIENNKVYNQKFIIKN